MPCDTIFFIFIICWTDHWNDYILAEFWKNNNAGDLIPLKHHTLWLLHRNSHCATKVILNKLAIKLLCMQTMLLWNLNITMYPSEHRPGTRAQAAEILQLVIRTQTTEIRHSGIRAQAAEILYPVIRTQTVIHNMYYIPLHNSLIPHYITIFLCLFWEKLEYYLTSLSSSMTSSTASIVISECALFSAAVPDLRASIT